MRVRLVVMSRTVTVSFHEAVVAAEPVLLSSQFTVTWLPDCGF